MYKHTQANFESSGPAHWAIINTERVVVSLQYLDPPKTSIHQITPTSDVNLMGGSHAHPDSDGWWHGR